MATSFDTSHRAVRIAGDALVLVIGLAFGMVWLCVAVDARNVGVVGVVNVAVCADGAVMRQLPVLRVVESRIQPRSCVVAGCAGRRESSGNVIRHVSTQSDRALPSCLMAAVAIRREIARIVVVDVAGRAGRCDVSAGKRKARSGVVEFPC